MLKYNHVEDTRPVTSIVLVQPKGSLDLTINKNSNGKRIRISNKAGETVNIAIEKIADFKLALDAVAARGVKVSQKA